MWIAQAYRNFQASNRNLFFYVYDDAFLVFLLYNKQSQSIFNSYSNNIFSLNFRAEVLTQKSVAYISSETPGYTILKLGKESPEQTETRGNPVTNLNEIVSSIPRGFIYCVSISLFLMWKHSSTYSKTYFF